MTISPSVPGVDAELVEVAVTSYKNLRAVRVPWCPRMVLYGVNGSGKTNLLEALALACGSRATMWQLAKSAAAPKAGCVSLLVRTSSRQLPLPPDRLPAEPRVSDDTDPLSEAGRVAAECGFWRMLGIERGASWGQAMWSGSLESALAELLTLNGQQPLIRYTLEAVEGLVKAAGEDRGERIRQDEVDGVEDIQFPRRFSRILTLEEPPPDWLIERSDDLPDLFAPLRAWLAAPEVTRSPYPDLISLPATDRVPVQMVWMATERSSDEVWFDLATEIWQATVRSRTALEYLADLPVWATEWAADGEELYQEDLDERAGIWLSDRAARAAAEVLNEAISGFGIYADSPFASGITIYSWGTSGSGVAETGLSEVGFLERLSSGERVWVDSALAHAAAEVERQGSLSLWRGTILSRLSERELLAAAIEAESAHIEMNHESQLDSRDPRAIDVVIDRLDRRLMNVEDYLDDPHPWSRLDDEFEDETARKLYDDVMREVNARAAFSPGVREIREMPARLTAYDEPERHLHPAAQRRVVASLDRVRPDHVVVATHSHLFLGRPGWKHLHLSKTAEGTVLNEFDARDLDRTDAITQEMGLTRGELLAFVRYVLVVEGIVDRLVLETLYGDLLGEAGVLLLPLHGINEVNSLAELTIIGELLDVGVGVLADHTRAKHLAGERLPQDATKEEQALWNLRRLLRRRGREIDLFGIKRIDVIAYIDETTVAERFPDFPGWEKIERRSRGGTGFKQAIEDAIGQPVRYRLVKELVETMAAEGRPAPGDLPSEVQRIVSRADQTHPSDDEGQADS